MSAFPIDAPARATFGEWGVLHLRGLLPEAVLAPVRDQIVALLERHGVWADGRWRGGRGDAARANRLRRVIKHRMKASDACRALEADGLVSAVTALAGEPVRTFMDRPQFLFTPPDAERWVVPDKTWHLDVPRLAQPGCPGIQVFCCIDPVVRGGGGTVVVAGSHRLLNDVGRLPSRDVKKRLAREPWFRALFRSGDDARSTMLKIPGDVGDVPVQVVELIGDPGDVYLVDMRTLHSMAPNCSDRPRLAATQRYFAERVAADLYSGEQERLNPATGTPRSS